MGLLLSNATILEGEDLTPVRGYLEVEDGKISKLEEGSPPRRGIDLKRAIVMPPFFNAHTHVGDSAWKELYLGRTQPEVVGPHGLKSRKLAKASKRRLIQAIRTTLADMLRTGTLAHCDFREGGVRGVKVLKEGRMSPLVTKILGRGSSQREIGAVLNLADGVGLPSMECLDEKELRNVARLTQRRGKLLSVHVDETETAHKDSLQERGKSELQRALELSPSFLVHATHARPEDLELLKSRRVPVVFCPRSNSLLGTGSPPIALALDLGVEFWLGTDNAMVCQPDMLEELKAAWQCIRRQNPLASHGEALELLRATTLKPREKFGLEEGGLQEGRKATFIILARGNNLRHLTDIHAGLVNRARVENIEAFFLEGKAFYFRSANKIRFCNIQSG